MKLDACFLNKNNSVNNTKILSRNFKTFYLFMTMMSLNCKAINKRKIVSLFDDLMTVNNRVSITLYLLLVSGKRDNNCEL